VRRVQPAFAGLGLLAAVVAGCGSSSPPTLVLSCVPHALPSGALRISAKVKNTTKARRDALLFGSALGYVTHVYPVLKTRQVVVRASGKSSPSIALLIPGIKAGGVVRVLLRLAAHRPAASLGVAAPSHTNGAVSSGSACRIRRR
jgi:hypothetical protein